MPDYENPKMGHPVFLELTPPPEIHYKIVPGKSNGMNVLGIVIFSATMGVYRRELSYIALDYASYCLGLWSVVTMMTRFIVQFKQFRST